MPPTVSHDSVLAAIDEEIGDLVHPSGAARPENKFFGNGPDHTVVSSDPTPTGWVEDIGRVMATGGRLTMVVDDCVCVCVCVCVRKGGSEHTHSDVMCINGGVRMREGERERRGGGRTKRAISSFLCIYILSSVIISQGDSLRTASKLISRQTTHTHTEERGSSSIFQKRTPKTANKEKKYSLRMDDQTNPIYPVRG